MKSNYLVYFFLLLTATTFVQCDDGDDVPAVCYPAELPVDEGTLKVTYNALDQPADVVFVNEDEPGIDYPVKFEYTDGRLTKISYFQGSSLQSYKTFERDFGRYIEHQFYKNGDDVFEESSRYIYYVNNDRITSRTYHQSFNDFATADSSAFKFDASGNVIQIDYYDASLEYLYKSEITFDDKLSPYFISGLNDSDNAFFTAINLSPNNPTRIKYIGSNWTEEDTFEYTYDSDGKVLTRKASWDGITRSIAWTCK